MLYGWLKNLLHTVDAHENAFFLDAIESSRTTYQQGDFYCFRLYLPNPSQALLSGIFAVLKQLPNSAKMIHSTAAFRDNLALVSMDDAVAATPVNVYTELTPITEETFQTQVDKLSSLDKVTLRFVSPTRLRKLKSASTRRLKGEARYARDGVDVSARLILERLHTAFAAMEASNELGKPHKIPALPTTDEHHSHWFWLDNDYKNGNGIVKYCGGLLGEIGIAMPNADRYWWQLLVLGQLFGIGNQRHFGMGRIEFVGLPAMLVTPVKAAKSRTEMLLENRYLQQAITKTPVPNREIPVSEAQLKALIQSIRGKRYRIPNLQGRLLQKEGKAPRPLAVPPWRDRLIQRVFYQVIGDDIDALMYDASHGYRQGRSRLNAVADIRKAYNEGYCWVFESDIDSFFDSVNRQHIHTRLACLLREDDFVQSIMDWLAAPVEFRGHLIQRDMGIPQGSPLSPLVANVILDDFDNDLKSQGMRMVRFADDFVVLCKTKKQAEKAYELAKRSLEEHDLTLNPKKTSIQEVEKGFHFLGYLFAGELVLPASAPATKQKNGIPAFSWLNKVPQSLLEEATSLNSNLAEHSDFEGDESIEPLMNHTTEVAIAPLQAKNPVIADINDPSDTQVDSPNIEQPSQQNLLVQQLNALVDNHSDVHFGERQRQGTLVVVSGEACTIHSHNSRLTVRRGEEVLSEQPFTAISALLLFGHHQMTSYCTHALLDEGIAVHFSTTMGRYLGVSHRAEVSGFDHMLWCRQLLLPEAEALEISKQLVSSRIRHQAETMRKRLPEVAASIKSLSSAAEGALNLAMLRGYEGAAAQQYFAAFEALLPDWCEFTGRKRRPPPDPVNALLSLGYTLLYGYADSYLRIVGLSPWHGIFHQGGGSHAALASDLMEPFRHVVERVVLSLIAKKQVSRDDFTQVEGACVISADARRTLLKALLLQLETKVTGYQEDQGFVMSEQLYRQARRLAEAFYQPGSFKAWRIR